MNRRRHYTELVVVDLNICMQNIDLRTLITYSIPYDKKKKFFRNSLASKTKFKLIMLTVVITTTMKGT